MKNILLTGVACLAPFLAKGSFTTGALVQESESSIDSPLSKINRLDKLAGEIEIEPATGKGGQTPIVEESTTPARSAPLEPKKDPLSSPIVVNWAVVSRTGNEIIRPESGENRKPADTGPMRKENQSRQVAWNYRRTLESCRF